jgi:Arc/MetJ family transcription regulator
VGSISVKKAASKRWSGAAPPGRAGGPHQRAAHAVDFIVQPPRCVGQRLRFTRGHQVLRKGRPQRGRQRLRCLPACQCGQRARQRPRHLGLAHRQRQQPADGHEEEHQQEAGQRRGQQQAGAGHGVAPALECVFIFPGIHMRTNIVIDDKLMQDALKATGLKTKREAVELGLRTLLRLRQQAELRSLKGKLAWQGDLGAMRADAK